MILQTDRSKLPLTLKMYKLCT